MSQTPEQKRQIRRNRLAAGFCTNCGGYREDETLNQCRNCRTRGNLQDAVARTKRRPMPMSTRAGSHARAIVDSAREFREFLRFKDSCPEVDQKIVDSMAKESLQRLIHSIAEYEKILARPINIRKRALKILVRRKLS